MLSGQSMLCVCCKLYSPVTMLAFFAACSTWSTLASAAQASRGVNVTVNLQGGSNTPPVASQPNSAFCQSSNGPGAFGATYTVVCATGAVVNIESGGTERSFSPIHGGAYRYVFQANRGSNQLGAMNSHAGTGTATSWRLVNLTDRDYLEILINW